MKHFNESLVLVLLFQAFTAFAQEIPSDITAAASANVFEVVVAKPKTDPFSYAEPLPLDLLSYSERNDPYYSIGTAFALKNGRFISAAHVFSLDNRTLRTDFALRDGKSNVYPIGRVLAYSEWRDYIVFEVPSLKPAGLQAAAAPKINSRVYATGNALGEGVILRDGTLTSLTPENWKGAWKWLRFSAPTSPGNSGGPLLDGEGKVLGVVVMKSESENLNYALPLEEVPADSKAWMDTRMTYTIPNISKSAVVEGHTSVDLPLTLDALRARLSEFDASLTSDAAARVLSENAAELFPQSPKSVLNFGDANLVTFPSILAQQSDGTWKPHTSDKKESALVGKDGRLSFGSFFNYTLMSLTMPSDMKLSELIGEPKNIMDLILQGYSLTRNISSKKIRITSMGKPSDVHGFTDAWGRPWFAAVWQMPLFDLGFLLIYTPTPNGLYCVYKQASYGELQVYETDFRVMSDFMVFSYSGNLTNWSQFFSSASLLPATLKDWSFSYGPGEFISVQTPRFSWYGAAKDVLVTNQGSIIVQPAFYKEGGKAVLETGLFAYIEGGDSKTSIVMFKDLKPRDDASDSEKQRWNAMLDVKYPYDGSVTRTEGKAYVRSIKLPDAGSGKAGAPLFTRWLTVSFDGQLDDKTLKARAAAVFKGFAMDPREIALSQGKDPSIVTALHRIKGRSIFDAVQAGDLAALKEFTSGKTDLDARDAAGLTPLLAALRAYQSGAALDLVSAGADVSAADGEGVTPLMLSMDGKFGTLPEIIMSRNAPVAAASKSGRTALDYALRNGRDQMAASLVLKGAPTAATDSEGWTPLLLALRYGCSSSFKLLLDRSKTADQKTAAGWTALHLAARFAPETLPALISGMKPLVNAKTDKGATPLSLAAQYADAASVKLLLEAGADPSLANAAGWTPLMWALRYGSASSAELLLATGKSAAGVNAEGWTALHFAARYKPELTAKIGGDSGLPRNAVSMATKAGYSALHLAVISRNPEAVRWLLKNGIDAGMKNQDGKTAADLAADSGDAALVELIRTR